MSASRCQGHSLRKRMRSVERRPAPHFQREQVRRIVSVDLGDVQQVLRPHPRRQQRLMGVAEGRVGQTAAASVRESTRRTSRARAPSAGRACRAEDSACCARSRRLGTGAGCGGCGLRQSLYQRVAVDDDLADVGEQLGRPVLSLRQMEQLGRFVDEARRDLALQETPGA